jgi:hypothetical protein
MIAQRVLRHKEQPATLTDLQCQVILCFLELLIVTAALIVAPATSQGLDGNALEARPLTVVVAGAAPLAVTFTAVPAGSKCCHLQRHDKDATIAWNDTLQV